MADGSNVFYNGATDESPAVCSTEALATALAAAEQAKTSDDTASRRPGRGAGEQGGEQITTRQLSLATLGRFATRAHQASAPYLSYAAMASQEAARFTVGRAKRYVDQMHAPHRRGDAPPGQIDSTKVDWSGVGARFRSLSWYDRQLVDKSRIGDISGGTRLGVDQAEQEQHEEDGDRREEGFVDGADGGGGGDYAWSSELPPARRPHGGDTGVDVGFGVRARPPEASVMATLKELDPWVTAPLFEDECNSLGPNGAIMSGRPPFAATSSDGSITCSRDCPSPSRGCPGDGPLDGLCESWNEDQEGIVGISGGGGGGYAGDVITLAPADTASMQEFRQVYESLVGAADIKGEMPEAARVDETMIPVVAGGLSASTPTVPSTSLLPPSPASSGLVQAHATALHHNANRAGDAIVLAAGAPPGTGFLSASGATSPPMPPRSASVTTAFLVKESSATAEPLASFGGANEAAVGAGAGAGEASADAGAPGTISSHDLLLEWLRREAGRGDEEAQFHLAQLFSPPRFEMKTECRECGETFGVTRYRHHCRHCGGSFCHEHAWHEHPIPKLGLPAPQRVCTPCKHTLELEDWRERVEWSLERVSAYLENRLIPYFDTGVDTVGDKALRVVDGAIYVAKSAPLGTAVKVSVEVMDVLMKYGTAGVAGLVLRREFVEAVDVLKRLSGVDKKWPMSVHEMTAAMYYLLAQRRGERGSAPNAEHEAHAGCEVVSDEELSFLRRMSALPLHFAYTKTALELQVLCNTTGWSLVFHKPDSRFHQPAFSLLACRTTMTVALVVRGTGSIHDVITDIQAMPVPFPAPRVKDALGAEADGWSDLPPAETLACSGMARAAEWLHREVVHQLIKLRREGHKVVVLGHSLGGGVAALLGVLLKDAIPDVRVVAFATPACADIGVSRLCEDLCTSVVLHDDVVPRVTPHSVRALLKDLLRTKEGWVKHLYNDWDAVVGRAKGLWAPRWRTVSIGATAAAQTSDHVDTAAASAAAVAAEGKAEFEPGSVGSESGTDEWGGRGSPVVRVALAREGSSGDTSGGGGGDGGGGGSGGGEAATAVAEAGGGTRRAKARWHRGAWAAVDVRSVQSRLSRMVDDTSARIRSTIVKENTEPVGAVASAAASLPPPFPAQPTSPGPFADAMDTAAIVEAGSDPADALAARTGGDEQGSSAGPTGGEGGRSSSTGSEEEAEVVEELPLPELYVPGRIIHIYSQRGVYRATEVPRDHDTLRTIPMYGNMLADHTSLAYFDALEEVAAVRTAEAKGEFMPDWVPYSASEVCQLCKADFSWASTSKSEAQRMKDKHNCRMCGLLVCDPCSGHRKPLPRVGVLEACRVCDRCFYGADPSRAI